MFQISSSLLRERFRNDHITASQKLKNPLYTLLYHIMCQSDQADVIVIRRRHDDEDYWFVYEVIHSLRVTFRHGNMHRHDKHKPLLFIVQTFGTSTNDTFFYGGPKNEKNFRNKHTVIFTKCTKKKMYKVISKTKINPLIWVFAFNPDISENGSWWL